MNDCDCWMCTHPEATPEDFRGFVREIIDRNGWMVQGVNGTRLHAPWAYTVGLTDHGLPELVVTGRRLASAGSILNGVADHTLREGQIRPGEVMHLGDLHLEAVGLPHPEAHLFTAEAVYGPQLTAVQMVWMDDRGRLPWEAGHRGGRGGQPVLGPRTSPPLRA